MSAAAEPLEEPPQVAAIGGHGVVGQVALARHVGGKRVEPVRRPALGGRRAGLRTQTVCGKGMPMSLLSDGRLGNLLPLTDRGAVFRTIRPHPLHSIRSTMPLQFRGFHSSLSLILNPSSYHGSPLDAASAPF